MGNTYNHCPFPSPEHRSAGNERDPAAILAGANVSSLGLGLGAKSKIVRSGGDVFVGIISSRYISRVFGNNGHISTSFHSLGESPVCGTVHFQGDAAAVSGRITACNQTVSLQAFSSLRQIVLAASVAGGSLGAACPDDNNRGQNAENSDNKKKLN